MTHPNHLNPAEENAASSSSDLRVRGAASAKDCSSGGCDHHQDHGATARAALAFAVIAAVALVTAWMSSYLAGQSFDHALSLATIAYWVSLFFGGFFASIDMVKSLARGHFTIDTLMVAAAIGATWIGHLPEGALLLTLFSLGHAAEHYAMDRAERSIQALAGLRPTTALRLNPTTGQANEVPISEIQIGDTVVVRPDSRVPVDGVVVAGESNIDQSPITGESIPVDKIPLVGFDALRDDATFVVAENKVFSGTINGSGSLNVQVTRTSEDTTLARVVRLIAEAKTQRSPTQRLTDAFERWFVPGVLVLVTLLLFAFLIIEEPFSESLYRAMAVLVAASPCALAIATPSAVLSAIARAGRDGVLIKGGGPLEQLAKVTAIAFDKTGTLTTGRPEVADVVTMNDVTRADLLVAAASLHRLSDHPLARAVVRASLRESVMKSHELGIETVTDVQRIAGQGVVAKLGGQKIAIGNSKLFLGPGKTAMPLPAVITEAEASLRQQGQTIAIVQVGDTFLGVIGMVDTLRPAAKGVIAELRKIGIQRMVMLSGDHREAAQAIASQLALDEAQGDLLPEDKVSVVSELSKHYITAMVGDGANDAPAMATASVSIAMGAAGSDVALETADIALMGDDLTKLPFAISLGQAATRIIRQNLWISLGMITFLVPATLFGMSLGPAVVCHEGSTLLVVANALRLLRFSPKKQKNAAVTPS